MGKITRLYICDRKAACAERAGCSSPDYAGECHHTTDRSHAKSGGFTLEEKAGELMLPDNVEVIHANDGSMFLVEHEEGEDLKKC